jgi:hypothetical protein
MTLTTVALGDDADFDTMKFLADAGGGRFYEADAPENLPRIFTREAFLASRSTIIEEPFTPRLVRPAQATNGIDWSSAPALGGYVGTAERDSEKSPAITSLVSDKDDPVYAVWQYGLGRAAAFTSDAKPQWAAGWMNWSGFGQFWAQVFRDTLRREIASELAPRVEVNAGRGHVSVEAVAPDGQFKNNLRLTAHVVAPDLKTIDIPLEQTASGRYEGDFAATAQGSYLVNVYQADGRPAPVTGVVNSYSPEFNITTSDSNLLAQISQATGGRIIPQTASDVNLFERHASRTRPHEILETLLLLAILLLPIDVGVRRVHIAREQLLQARAWIESKLRRPAQAEANAETAASHAQLKDARSRVRLGEGLSYVKEIISEPVKSDPAASPAPVIAKAKRDETTDEPLSSRLLDARKKRQS